VLTQRPELYHYFVLIMHLSPAGDSRKEPTVVLGVAGWCWLLSGGAAQCPIIICVPATFAALNKRAGDDALPGFDSAVQLKLYP